MKIKLLYTLLLSIIFLSSCNDKLGEPQKKLNNIVPTDVKYLQALLSYDNKYFKSLFHVYFTDDVRPSGELISANEHPYNEGIQFVSGYDIKGLSLYEDIGPNNLWDKSYGMLYEFNTVLDYLPDVAGTEEEKNYVRGQDLFMRAYYHFDLARYYCLPYSTTGDNFSTLGIPLKTNISLNDMQPRPDLEATYEHILGDLAEAEELLKDAAIKTSDRQYNVSWRASNCAVYALKAKVLLTLGDFENALMYAEKAIASVGRAKLYDFNDVMKYYTVSFTQKDENGNDVDEEINYPFTGDPAYIRFEWEENIYTRNLTAVSPGRLIPSDDLISLYGSDENRDYDLRWKYWYIENGSLSSESFRGKIDNVTGGYSAPIVFTTYNGYYNAGLSVPELYLIKAECEARSGDIGKAQSTINEFRANRFSTDAPSDIINLAFANKNDAITKILQERRREMPFISRFYDLKRLYGYGDTQHLPVITHEYFEINNSTIYTDKPKDCVFDPVTDYKKFAFPIPVSEIDLARAMYNVDLIQNEY